MRDACNAKKVFREKIPMINFKICNIASNTDCRYETKSPFLCQNNRHKGQTAENDNCTHKIFHNHVLMCTPILSKILILYFKNKGITGSAHANIMVLLLFLFVFRPIIIQSCPSYRKYTTISSKSNLL